MRILVISQDQYTRNFLDISFDAVCFAVDLAVSARSGSFLGRTNDYDIIIMEHLLSEQNCVGVCKEIRKAGKKSPIIIIAESKKIEDKIACFNAGADDYILKPFSFDELLARTQVLLRRPHRIEEVSFEIDNIRLEVHSQRVLFREKEIYLTKKEFALLEYLMKNKGMVLSRGMILEHVWNTETNPFSNTIETHIMNLRKKIRDIKKKLIVSIPGRGYKIIA